MAIKITKIQKSSNLSLTVDIEVEDTHSYQLSNGAVSHNSVILGTASGIHGEHSEKYFRHVQMNVDDDVVALIQDLNPKMIEKSVWSANGTDVVVAFPIETKEHSIYKRDLLGVKQLEYVKKAQQFWVEEGTRLELCVDKNLRHNISNTISVDNWDEVEQYIFDNIKWFAGISLLGVSGDKTFAQAPFTEVLSYDEIHEKYDVGSMFASGLIVEGLHAFDKNLWLACDTVLGRGLELSEDSDDLLKRDWIRRAKKFADNYFDGNLEKMTFCLKDCHNLHKWETIQRSIQPINFAEKLGAQHFVEIDEMGSQACSGGACEVSF